MTCYCTFDASPVVPDFTIHVDILDMDDVTKSLFPPKNWSPPDQKIGPPGLNLSEVFGPGGLFCYVTDQSDNERNTESQ